uniref:hypothetical protein n=1 Tax=Fulvivirga sp. TaxID=1931237 RepID=UPI00404B335C
MINIQISTDTSINNDIKRLFEDILKEMELLIPNGPFLGNKQLNVIKYLNHPITITTALPNVYLIGVTPDIRVYDQLTYQFAHEIGHVYSDPRNNNWLIESFCEAMSFIMLERIGLKWKTNPSVPDMHWYSVNFKNYMTSSISNYLTELNIQEQDIKEFKLGEAVENLTSPINRQINFILAYRILQYYRINESLLTLIPFLHYTSSKENLGENELFTTVQPDINRFESNLPNDLKRIWDEFKQELI